MSYQLRWCPHHRIDVRTRDLLGGENLGAANPATMPACPETSVYRPVRLDRKQLLGSISAEVSRTRPKIKMAFLINGRVSVQRTVVVRRGIVRGILPIPK